MIRSLLRWRFRSRAAKQSAHVHDWEVIDRQTDYAIYLRLHRKHSDQSSQPSPPLFQSSQEHIQAVCLSCGKRVDEIRDRELELEEQYREEKRRRELAKTIWESITNKDEQ